MAVARIFELAHQEPDKTAVVHNGVSFSYGWFARRIESARRYLALQNLPVGTVAAVCVGSHLDAWVLGFGLRSLGLTTIVTRDRQLMAGLRNSRCVVTTTAEYSLVSTELAGDARWRVIGVSSDDRLADLPVDLPSVAPPGSHIILTSGTTGSYKKVLRDAAAETRAIITQAEVYGITDQSRVYVGILPPWTDGGYRCVFR